MKRFNLTGVCIPERHYMVDLSERVDCIIRDYVDQGQYFTINRERQFGTPTLLSFLHLKVLQGQPSDQGGVGFKLK